MSDQPISDKDPEQLRKCDDPEQEFMDVVESGDLERVRRILDADPGWISEIEKYDTPFYVAQTSEMAELLLEYGANPNARGDREMTPLHFAAYNDELDVVPVLIAAGAELDSIDEYGCTPLTHAARSMEGLDICTLLLDAGASYDIPAAAALGDLDRVRLILEQNPDAITKAAGREWLFSGLTVCPNCPDELRVPIMRLLLEHYDWGKSFLAKQAAFCVGERLDDLAIVILDFSQKSQKP